MRARRRNLAPEERIRLDETLRKHLASSLRDGPWEKVCLYHPSDGEPDLLPLTGLFPAKAFYYPVVTGDRIDFYLVRPGGRFFPGAFGIPEPEDKGSRLERTDRKTAVWVPGVVFDREGGRIGRGRGFYDRFFAQEGREAFKIGTGYSFQVLPGPLPLKKTDVRMDCVITDEGLLKK